MTEPPPKTRRRCLRFSLRGMLLAILLIGGALGWTLHKAREQRIAVAALEKVGCRISYAFEEPPTALELLRKLSGEVEPRHVVEVFAVGGQFSDADMVYLKALPDLLYLELSETQVTDSALAHLRGLPKLSVLDLHGTHVTDAGLIYLQGMTQLNELGLCETQVTDAGVHALKKALPRCRFVWDGE